MPATLFFCADNSTSQGTQARGSTSTTGISNISFSNVDDNAGSYASNPISAGSNSYDKYLFLYFSGSFNSISQCKFQHVSGVLGSNISFFFGTGSSGFYATPSVSTNAALTFDLTSTGSLATGISIALGSGSPNIFAGKGSSSTVTPTFSSFIGGQLRTTSSAAAGNASSAAPYVFGVSWLES